MSFTVTLSFPKPRFLPLKPSHPPLSSPLLLLTLPSITRSPNLPPRSNHKIISVNANTNIVDDPRNWSRPIGSDYVYGGGEGEEDEDEGDEEEEERSLDLFVRFVHNVFNKVSKRARKAVRSVLPPSFSSKLVGFAVNGVLVLAFLWVLKAFLEVICTLGTVVFVSILLIRVVWSSVNYLQESRYFKMNGYDDEHRPWTGAQPVS